MESLQPFGRPEPILNESMNKGGASETINRRSMIYVGSEQVQPSSQREEDAGQQPSEIAPVMKNVTAMLYRAMNLKSDKPELDDQEIGRNGSKQNFGSRT